MSITRVNSVHIEREMLGKMVTSKIKKESEIDSEGKNVSRGSCWQHTKSMSWVKVHWKKRDPSVFDIAPGALSKQI